MVVLSSSYNQLYKEMKSNDRNRKRKYLHENTGYIVYTVVRMRWSVV